jgi:hypothetical protein
MLCSIADVYARRFESKKTGKVGYQPACSNEWDRVLCDKRRVKCSVCQNRRFLPLTDEVIRRHLSGRDETGKDFAVGVYPMLQDETCFFLAVDFDKKSWSEDAGAYLETCRQLGLTACLERSRSGRGGHIWLFFQEPIPAALARKLGSHILTEIMERPDIGLDSMTLFPNQDTLPTGGFGNLIALPMQKQARERGNSLFLGDQCIPYPDQWAFLSTIQKIGRQELEEVQKAEGEVECGVRLAQGEDDDTPWITAFAPSDFPSRGRFREYGAGSRTRSIAKEVCPWDRSLLPARFRTRSSIQA